MPVYEPLTSEKLGRDDRSQVRSILNNKMFSLLLPPDSSSFCFLGRKLLAKRNMPITF